MGQGRGSICGNWSQRISYKAIAIVSVRDDGGSKVEEWQWKWKDRCKFKIYFRVTKYHRLETNKYVRFAAHSV